VSAAQGGALSSTQRLSSGGMPALDSSVSGSSSAASGTRQVEPEKPASPRVRGEIVHEALHDEFFDAGDQGTYEGGHGAGVEPALLDDELEADVPRVIVRTPEQEQRRARLMQVVGVVVGVVLGVFVFAILRGRASEPEPRPVEAPAAEAQPAAPAAAQPPPPPEVLTPPPPPPVEPPPAAPEPEPPAPLAEKPKPAAKPPEAPAAPAVRKPAPVARPVEAAAPPPKPATQPRPAGPLPPPAPAAGKFPD
jgi:hypothetical protein